MNQKSYQRVFPTTLIILVAFFSTLMFVNPSPLIAATGKAKAAPMTRTSAVDYAELQIKQLQSSLNITAEQEPLWKDLAVLMRENAKDTDALRKQRAENRTGLNAVERMKFHSQVSESQLNQLKKFIPVFEAFYNSLSDDQKKNADEIFSTGKYRKTKRK
ncbi:LTXXQ motif family protein [Trichlorobacter thiogenes]|uniref:LTXXQ motif family protein n=1 Tax=Trichlorobacter thiogenes TaxID=115783 RepID=A0A1T4QY86_9BACT|nr:Spy/CpxP family protein refolding chaperone [Trichlorobacter thiogenes]SKA08527.1 LTXXQ motif family protein [Trichlorobacter thiogenes]